MKNPVSEALCTRCAHAGGCTVPSDIEEPVVSCDTFTLFEQVCVDIARDVALPDPSRVEGLCGDCANRASCVFRGREGGTWHCEEYC